MVGGGRVVGSLGGWAYGLARARGFIGDLLVLGYGAIWHACRRFSSPATDGPKPGRRFFRLTRKSLRERAPKLEALLAASVFALAGVYGTTIGGHWGAVQAAILQLPDSTANGLGFGIHSINIEGQRGLTDEEVLEALRITESHSLFFLDVGSARERLVANPLVADAQVRKIYPDRLAVTLRERSAFALWQVGGEVSIISEDGTVIDQLRDRRFADLPLVVGAGAAQRAKAFEQLVAGYPTVGELLYAGVFVAERRWNLRLRNGVDVLLPEDKAEVALSSLAALIARKDVLDRDIAAIDLRIPDQIVVRLSEQAAGELAKLEKTKKQKGRTT